MYNKLVKHKIGHFRMWKSGKQWLFGASVLAILAVGSATPALANETEATGNLLASGNNVGQATLVQEQENLVPEVSPEPEVTSESEVTPELEQLNSETSSEAREVSPDSAQEMDNSSSVATQEPLADASSATTTTVEEVVSKPEPLKSVKDSYTPPIISESQEWTHGVSRPNKDELTWQKEYYQGYYTAPYKDGSQLFDANKDYTANSGDFGLCSAGVAANMLHWWLANNKEYVDKYLEESATNGVVTPDNYKPIDLREHRNYEGGHKSQLFDLFKTYFSKSVYTHRVLDLFFSGYPDARKYEVNNEANYRERETKGTLDQRGGFFKDVFGQKLLTSREEVSDLVSLGSKIKQALRVKKALAVDYLFNKYRGHIVNVWGAEFDNSGKLTALYVTDTDDHTAVIDAKDGKPLQSLKRYTVVDRDGKAYITNNYDGSKGVAIRNLYTLDLGEQQWKDYFAKSKEESDKAVSTPVAPSIPETPRSTDTHIGPKTELKVSRGNAEDTSTARVVPSTDSNVAIGSKTVLVSPVPTDTPDQSKTDIGTKPELKIPIKTNDSETDMEIPRIPEIPRSTATQIGPKTELRSLSPAASTPEFPSISEIPRSTDTHIGPKTELKVSTGNTEDTSTARVVPSTNSDVAIGSKTVLVSQVPTDAPDQSKTEIGTKPELKIPDTSRSTDTEVGPKTELESMAPSASTPEFPSIQETPRSTDTQIGPKTKLKVSAGNTEDTSTAHVVPPTDSNVAIGSKTVLVSSVPIDTPDQSKTDIGTKPELKIPEVPRSTDTQIGPKTKLKVSAGNTEDTSTARVVPSTDPNVAIGSKTVLVSQVPNVTPDQSNTEIGTKSELKIPETPRSTDTEVGPKTELKSMAPSASTPEVPSIQETPRSTDTQVGPKTELKSMAPSASTPEFPSVSETPRSTDTHIGPKTKLKVSTSDTNDSSTARMVPSTDSNVAIGSKTVLVASVPTDTPDQSKTDIGTKPELKIPEVPRSTDTQIGPKTELKVSAGNTEDTSTARVVPSTDSNVAIGSKTVLVSQVPTDAPDQSKTEIGTKPESKIPIKTNDSETDMEIPRIPEIPRSTATQVGPKTVLKSLNPSVSAPEVPKTSRLTDTEIASKTKLKVSTGNTKDTSTARVVPSIDSDLAISTKSEISSSVTPETPFSPEIGQKPELKGRSDNAEASSTTRVVPQADSEVTIDAKSEIVPQVPMDTPDQSRTEINTQSVLTPDSPVTDNTGSDLAIGTKSEISSSVIPETPFSPEIGQKSELKNPDKNHKSVSDTASPRILETPRSTSTQVGPKTELNSVSPTGDDASEARVVSSRKEERVGAKNASETNYELTNNKAADKNQTQHQSGRLVVKKNRKNVEDSHLQDAVHYCSVALVLLLGSIWGLRKLKKEK
ncbi:IdeS/Mac family cysteine endopeptidase [Streptococcus halotolerans]|uniref:IdeS/Mac family cysteine endopeptidase n=1 Tax=Streptococcus halotolerans TaxID=1814128 RepID=UPI000788A2A1|nr:IdeS/Mac family cysteine endopeptidase [Streptococcus halotolerans]